MKFFDPYDYKGSKNKEINSGELLVETCGYVPLKKQIQNFVNAGIQLENFRKGLYDFNNIQEVLTDEDTFEDDVARDPDVDIVELKQLQDTITERLADNNSKGFVDDIGPSDNNKGGESSSVINSGKVDVDGSGASKEAMNSLE